jgi:hypothetical protein
MNFFTEEQEAKLLDNGHEDNRGQDHAPVVKLFFPAARCVWLLNKLLPDKPGMAYGLCDLGMGFPELGNMSLEELASVNISNMTVQRDNKFIPAYPMSVYAEAARNLHAITENPAALQQAKAALEEERNKKLKPE